jgi:hypothetical protein
MLSDKRHVPFPPEMLMCLIETVLRQMSGIPAPQRKFITVLLTTWMCGRGKVNYRNLSRYSEIHEKTYSRWFRREFDCVEFNLLGSDSPQLAA